MGDTEAANDIDMAQESSSPDDMPMPDIAPERDAGPVLHDHGIWGKCENVVDPEAYKAAREAEAQNENAL